MKELILGGVRSGKSTLEERLALASGLAVTYVATARGDDEEMRARIRHHRERRPAAWELVEVGHDLAAELHWGQTPITPRWLSSVEFWSIWDCGRTKRRRPRPSAPRRLTVKSDMNRSTMAGRIMKSRLLQCDGGQGLGPVFARDFRRLG